MEPYDDDDDDGYNGDDDDFPDEKINFLGSQGPGPLARGPRKGPGPLARHVGPFGAGARGPFLGYTGIQDTQAKETTMGRS